MRTCCCFLIFLLLTSKNSFSQTLLTKDSVNTDKYYFPVGLGFSFNSNNFHSGFRFSLEHSLKINRYNKYKSDSIYKTKYNITFINYNILYNRDKNFNTSYAVSFDYGIRKIKKKGRMKELVGGVGITKTFLTKAAFSVEKNKVKQRTLTGNLYGNINTMLGFGKDYSLTKNIPLKWHVRIGTNILFPYGNFILPYFAIDVGVIYKIKTKPFATKYLVKNKLN